MIEDKSNKRDLSLFKVVRALNYHVKTDRVVNTEHSITQQDIENELVCPICSNLLLDPKDCLTCDTSFC